MIKDCPTHHTHTHTHTHTHRLAAEEQVKGLQSMVDETFQQFALDDSEDDDLCDGTSDEGSTPNLLRRPLNGHIHTHSTPELSLT